MSRVIPEHWVQTELNAVADITTGNTPSTKEPSFYGGKLPFVKPGDLDTNFPITNASQFLTESGAEKSRILRKGASLVSCIGNLGKVGYAGVEVATNQQINSAEFHREVLDDRFGYYQCRTLKQWMEREASATTISILNKKKFGEAPFVVAPLPEQRRIADKLDSVLTRVDALNDRLARITPLLKRFRQSVLAAATSGRLTEDWQLTSVSEKWKKTNLSEICFVTKLAGFEYTNFVKYSNDGDLNVVKAENVGKDGFKYTEFSKIKSGTVNHLTRSKIKEGDLLMVFVGAGTGQVGRVPDGENWFLGPNVAMIRPLSEENNSRFIEYFLRSQNGLNEIKKFVKSTAQPSLSMTSIRQFEVSLPNLDEQTEIVRRVETLFAYADRLEARLQTACTAADRLAPALLAKAFRGELVPQDPNDEPASELLRRLREARAAQPSARKARGSKAAAGTTS